MNYEYPLEECLKVIKEYGVKEASAFLLEKSGDI